MGRSRARARLFATTMVAATVIVSAAYANLSSTPSNPDSALIPYSLPDRVIFSLRNTGFQTETVTSIQTMQGSNCPSSKLVLSRIDGQTSLPILAPGEQVQYAVDTNGLTMADTMAGDPTCTYVFVTTSGSASVPVTFHPRASTTTSVDEQAKQLSFAPAVFASETQQMALTALNSDLNGVTATITGGNGQVTFADQCPGQTTCPLSTLFKGSAYAISLTCSPQTTSVLTGTIDLTSGTALPLTRHAIFPLGNVSFTCAGNGSGSGSSSIDIVETSLTLGGMVGNLATATANVQSTGMMTDAMGSATITGSDAGLFTFTDVQHCAGQTCSFVPAQPTPTTIQVACTPPDTTPHTATLTVYGTATAGDMDFATLTCQGSGTSGPIINVNPGVLGFGQIGVGATAGPQTVTISNTGSAPLTNIHISGLTNDWFADACVLSDCSLAPGTSQAVHVTFTPHMHGDDSVMMAVDSNDTVRGTQYVSLQGSATGGVLDPPSPADIDFGTIPRGQMATRTVTLHDSGNAQIVADIAMPPAPFSVAQSSVMIGGGSDAPVDFRCGSDTAGGPYDAAIAITSSNAYSGSPQQVTAHCTIADTSVQVMPTSFDFGEVRTGATARSMTLTITNPAGAPPTQLVHARLDGSRPGLSLNPGDMMMTLNPGDVATATLALDPTSETVLDGVNVTIDVGAAHLVLPVLGKVTRPSSRIAPKTLELGTSCTGTAVSGAVMLINDGTATLGLDAPTADGSFMTSFVTPMSYPASLAASDTAIVNVAPTMTTEGVLTGNLTWRDDAPDVYTVPIHLEYISTGTALSPDAIDFGAVPVDVASPAEKVTIENCDPETVTVTIKGIQAIHGAASVWTVEPAPGYAKTLTLHQTQIASLRFVPTREGIYDANLELDVNGKTRRVALHGETGSYDPDHTSFYACTCSGPGGSPAGGLPIALAIVAISVRRRRGSS